MGLGRGVDEFLEIETILGVRGKGPQFRRERRHRRRPEKIGQRVDDDLAVATVDLIVRRVNPEGAGLAQDPDTPVRRLRADSRHLKGVLAYVERA